MRMFPIVVVVALALPLALMNACGDARDSSIDSGSGGSAGHAGVGGTSGGGAATGGAGGAPESFLVNVTSNHARICPGDCVALTVTASDGVAPYQVRWSDDSAPDVSVSVCPAETTTYRVTVSDASFDSEFGHRNPDVTASVQVIVDDASLCVDASVPFDAATPIDAAIPGDPRELCSTQISFDGWFSTYYETSGTVLTADVNGDTVFVGSFQGSFTTKGVTSTSVGTRDGLMIKVDRECRVVWVKTFAETGNGTLSLLSSATDAQRNIYVVGTMTGTTDFGDGLLPDVPDAIRGFVLKFDPNGVLLWKRIFTSNWSAVGVEHVTVDPQGRVTMIGHAGADTTLGGLALGIIYARNVPFLAQLDVNGAYRWSKPFTAGDHSKLVLARNSDLVVAGWSSAAVDFGAGALVAAIGGRYLARLDATGSQLWVSALDRGQALSDWEYWRDGLAVDASDNVIMLRDAPEDPASTGAQVLDDTIEKYGADGRSIWSRRLSVATEYPGSTNALATDSQNNTFRYGIFSHEVVYGALHLVADGPTDLALLKIDVDGHIVAHVQFGGPSWDYSAGIAIDSEDRVSVVDSTDAEDGSDARLWTLRKFAF